VYSLIELVQQRVEESSGVHLERELRCIGFAESR
jgi:UDP-N-acetylenolpyruvoylglucosamine reductase